MSAEQLLKDYISQHPDYWEFENELNEVNRLKKLITTNSKTYLNCTQSVF